MLTACAPTRNDPRRPGMTPALTGRSGAESVGLTMFPQLGDVVDDEAWMRHSRRGFTPPP